jgi:hypothetical protein
MRKTDRSEAGSGEDDQGARGQSRGRDRPADYNEDIVDDRRPHAYDAPRVREDPNRMVDVPNLELEFVKDCKFLSSHRDVFVWMGLDYLDC